MLSSDVQKLSVDSLITLFELDATRLGGERYRFHGHNDGVIRFLGQEYHPIAIKADGLEVRGDGRASAPTLTLANQIGDVVGAVSALCLRFDDFAGAKLIVIQTLSNYLSDPNANHKKQLWFIEQKMSENNAQVVFELSNPVDFEGLKIPCREITNYCHWAVCGRYRGQECGYIGAKKFTQKGEPTTIANEDKCGGTLTDCQLRFGEDNPLPFGGFPASSLGV